MAYKTGTAVCTEPVRNDKASGHWLVTYAEFIADLERLANRGDALIVVGSNHEARPFCDWRLAQ